MSKGAPQVVVAVALSAARTTLLVAVAARAQKVGAWLSIRPPVTRLRWARAVRKPRQATPRALAGATRLLEISSLVVGQAETRTPAPLARLESCVQAEVGL